MSGIHNDFIFQVAFAVYAVLCVMAFLAFALYGWLCTAGVEFCGVKDLCRDVILPPYLKMFWTFFMSVFLNCPLAYV